MKDAVKRGVEGTGLGKTETTLLAVVCANIGYWGIKNPSEVLKVRRQAGVVGDDTLGAATELLRQLRVIKNLVEPCFPPAYAILSKYRYEIEKLLVPEIQALYDDRSISNLEPEELLAINEFLDYYNESMQSIGEDGTCQSFKKGSQIWM